MDVGGLSQQVLRTLDTAHEPVDARVAESGVDDDGTYRLSGGFQQQMAAVGKDFRQWADDFFAEDSGHLDCDLKAEQVLADFNQETKFGWAPKKMTQHLNAYCQFAEHIHCLNPATITHKASDGERWVKRDENGQQKAYYHVQSVKAAEEAAKTEPVQTNLAFETDQAKEWTNGEPF